MDATSVVRSMGDPAHLSMDGTLRNPYIAIAVTLIVTSVVFISYYGTKYWVQRNFRLAILLLATMVGLWIVSIDLYQLIAAWLEAMVARRVVPVTFFGSPPSWILPLAVAITAISFLTRQRLSKGTH